MPRGNYIDICMNMLNAIRISSSAKIGPQSTNSSIFSPDRSEFPQNFLNSFKLVSLVPKYVAYLKKVHVIGGKIKALTSTGEEGSVQAGLDSSPVSVELELISRESQFDRVIAEAQQLEESVIILWMATWCRKCIYLKPKLEKLAADYYPRIRFYCVDVNNVPHKLVVHAEITKMPTIQLWRDSKKQAEVIGGHRAYLVVNEVREMIENEYTI